jgi:alpha-ketoglutarate-dependent taurine dioxygenase
MSPGQKTSRLQRFKESRPQPMAAGRHNLIAMSRLPGGEHGTPVVISPRVSDVSLVGWARASADFIDEQLLTSGALLFRGFTVADAAVFGDFARSLSEGLLDYTERAAPRTMVVPGVYTSTEFPADQYIPLHHEMSYSHQWPRRIWFFCERPSSTGGCTPISDDRVVFRLLRPEIKDLFTEKGVMYIRNFGEGVDLSWQQAFQTDQRRDVESYCEANGIDCEWRSGDRLRTRQIRQVVVNHPETGETVWFNHAHLFHWSSIEPATRQALLAQFAEHELPRNACFGDGDPIAPELLEEIRRTYEKVAVRFTWQAEDILMLDNILVSHARDPFSGPRRVLVAMSGWHRASNSI